MIRLLSLDIDIGCYRERTSDTDIEILAKIIEYPKRHPVFGIRLSANNQIPSSTFAVSSTPKLPPYPRLSLISALLREFEIGRSLRKEVVLALKVKNSSFSMLAINKPAFPSGPP